MIKLTFKQTDSEMIVRAAASVLFGTLARRGAKLVSISDLAERPQYGFTASAAIEPIGPKFVRITDLQDGKIDWDIVPFCECAEPEKYLLQDDDLLFARTGATTGKTHLVKDAERAVFASYLIRLRPKPGVFAGYLHAFFQSDAYWTQISDEKEGSAQPNVNGEKLAALQIPRVELKLQHAIADFLRCVRRRQDGEKVELPELPAPLAEQRRVVARIEELAAQIHEARTLRHQAAEEAEALVGAKASTVFRDAMKNGHADLESVAKLERGKFHHRPRNEPRFFGGDHPWIQIGEIESADKFVRRWSQTLNDDGLAISKKFPRGTVLISIAATIGAVGILDFDCCVPDSIVGVTPKTGTESEFLYHYLRYLRSHLEEIAPQSAQKNINLGILTKMPVPKLPLVEQRRIVAELDALQAEVDVLKRLQAETAQGLDALLPSILDRAFKGEL